MNTHLKKIVTAALFAALTCVATMAIKIPTPGTNGYIHPGDAFVILSGIFLGPFWGFMAAGIGSAIADLLGGYFIYVPITLIIKGLIAFTAGHIYHKVGKNMHRPALAVILSGIIDILFVSGGYFLCEFVLYGFGAAASIPANLIQGFSGLILSSVLYPVLFKIPDIHQLALESNLS